MKQLFQYPAGEKFQGRGQHHGPEKQGRDTAGQGREQDDHDHHAEAVNGADGAVEKTPVHESAGFEGGKRHFGAPAQKSVCKEDEQNLIERQGDAVEKM